MRSTKLNLHIQVWKLNTPENDKSNMQSTQHTVIQTEVIMLSMAEINSSCFPCMLSEPILQPFDFDELDFLYS